jgi:hypothetical protein
MFIINAYLVLTAIGVTAFWALAVTGRDRGVRRNDTPAVRNLPKAA